MNTATAKITIAPNLALLALTGTEKPGTVSTPDCDRAIAAVTDCARCLAPAGSPCHDRHGEKGKFDWDVIHDDRRAAGLDAAIAAARPIAPPDWIQAFTLGFRHLTRVNIPGAAYAEKIARLEYAIRNAPDPDLLQPEPELRDAPHPACPVCGAIGYGKACRTPDGVEMPSYHIARLRLVKDWADANC